MVGSLLSVFDRETASRGGKIPPVGTGASGETNRGTGRSRECRDAGEEECDVAERSGDRFRQGLHDLDHARTAAAAEHDDWACFAAQQAAEEALKALASRLGGEAWGHSLLSMVTALGTVEPEISSLREVAIRLDRYYIPTRYPNGFDAGAPVDYFLESDAREAIHHAEQVIELVRRRLP
jgi:HEPN domain-containing protein